MRRYVRRCRSLIAGAVALLGVLAGTPAFSQQFGPIYRGGVDTAVPAANPEAATRQQYLFVVAGDVHRPGVFISNRPTVTAEDLIERAGGSSALYEPMVHRIVRGGRVIGRIRQTEASSWEFADGDILLVVERSGVRDARRDAPSLQSHVVCFGLSPLPVVVHLPEGRTSLGDLLDILGQPRELLDLIQVLPVRVEIPARIEPGTVVIFPPDRINANAIPFGVLSQAMPLEPETGVMEPAPQPEIDDSLAQPAPVEASTPSLLPSRSTPVVPPLNPLFTPGEPDGPTASTPAGNLYVPGSGIFAGRPSIEQSPVVEEILLSHSLVPSEQAAPASTELIADSITRTAAITTEPVAASATNPWPHVAIYTGGLALTCLVLASIWTYWDRLRSLVVAKPRANAARTPERPQPAPIMQPVNQVQALIDNRIPVIEETVEVPQSRQFQGEAVGQRRLRLDQAHALAGPRAIFRGVTADAAATLHQGDGEQQVASERQTRESRQLQRVMAHLTASQSRSGKQRVAANEDEREITDSRRAASSQIQRESALERALRQVMRKARS